MANERSEFLKLQELVKEAIRRDVSLREKYDMGEKFRFVKDKLQALLTDLESQIQLPQEHIVSEKSDQAAVTEVDVYVYLYNAQGLTLTTWRNMLTRKLLYEYSVNRPIYTDKNHIVSLIKSKANKVQHGFLTIKISEKDILKAAEELVIDALGNPVIKIKEGSLKFEKLLSFTHNENDYSVSGEGDMKKIEPK